MSKQSQQRARLDLYRELSDIVDVMKNMAEVELHRARCLERNLQETLATASEGMALLLRAAPSPDTRPEARHTVLIVLGSERGFCGGFNEQLVRALAEETEPYNELLIVGGRLATKGAAENGGTLFPAPATTDEILPCVQQLMDHLLLLPAPLQVDVLSHGKQALQRKQLLPWVDLPETPAVVRVDTPCPPALLVDEMQWQCLYQHLFQAMLISLLRENRLRLQQMEGAREHLDTLITYLHLRLNALRQQEIVEEIEITLTSRPFTAP